MEKDYDLGANLILEGMETRNLNHIRLGIPLNMEEDIFNQNYPDAEEKSQ